MGRLLRTLVALGLAVAAASVVGFMVFAHTVRTFQADPKVRADAIVVLTGDEERISTGMRLMEAGRARHMLISGVHPSTRIPKELQRHIRGSEDLVKCCVEMGREAVNTSGNAEEARAWAEQRGFRSLIVVTSSYHMPRSLVEFQRAMPGMSIVAHPAMSKPALHEETWWRNRATLRLLAAEYVKYVGASARLVLARLLDEGGSPVLPVPSEEAPRTVGAVR